MTHQMRLVYSTILALIVSTAYFVIRVFDGTSYVSQDSLVVGLAFLYMSIILIIVLIAVFIILTIIMKPQTDEVVEDERSMHIEHQVDRMGYYALSTALTILVAYYVITDIWQVYPFQALNLDSPFGWCVWIILVMSLVELGKCLVVMLMNRP